MAAMIQNIVGRVHEDFAGPVESEQGSDEDESGQRRLPVLLHYVKRMVECGSLRTQSGVRGPFCSMWIIPGCAKAWLCGEDANGARGAYLASKPG